MSAIGPGDWVECVNNTPLPDHSGVYLDALRELRVGAIYQVRAFGLGGTILLVGLQSGSERLGYAPPHGWMVARFRPVYRPNQEIIESLKQPAPAGVRELEDA